MGPTGPTQTEDARLRDAGLRVTAQRLAVLGAYASSRTPPSTTSPSALARVGSISIRAVYDVLRALAQAALVRRIASAGSPARFEARVGDNHHHLVCRACGEVADVDCVVGHAPCLAPANAAGYVIDEADVTYWGVCPACQMTTRDHSTGVA